MTHEYHGEALILLGMVWFFGVAIMFYMSDMKALTLISGIINLAIWWYPAWKLGSIGLKEVNTQSGFNKWVEK